MYYSVKNNYNLASKQVVTEQQIATECRLEVRSKRKSKYYMLCIGILKHFLLKEQMNHLKMNMYEMKTDL